MLYFEQGQKYNQIVIMKKNDIYIMPHRDTEGSSDKMLTKDISH